MSLEGGGSVSMYATRANRRFGYGVGWAASLGAHVGCFALSLLILQHSARHEVLPNQIFTVTLEGGERLGGISQVPKDDSWKNKKALPNATDGAEPEKSKSEPAKPKEIDQPTLIEQQKLEAEKKLKEAKEKAEAEKQKKLEDEKKKQQAAEDDKKRAEAEKAQAEKERKQRDDRLEKAISRAASRYHGESANAGGQGFGAAALGGKGMGGGTLASIEFIAYRNDLERHIKSGWRWLPGPEALAAQVEFTLLPDGTIQDPSLVSSSGNSNFDESAIRAVYKASPAPAPPAGIYDKFRQCRITFDSQQ